MIALLKGTPSFYGNRLVMLCGGVGYGVAVNERLAQELRLRNGEVELFIHTHVREDALELFGFQTPEELGLFETMLSVSGVGPKTALVITSATVADIRRAVAEGNVGFFSSFPRVGKKLAQKIIIELKPKLGSLEDLDLAEPTGQTGEVRQALEALGYAEHDIHRALREIKAEEMALQDAIKAAMKILNTK